MKNFNFTLFNLKVLNQFSLKVILLFISLSFTYQTYAQHSSTSKSGKLDIQAIKEVLKIKGTEKDGEYKISVPQNDLDVEVDGFEIIPPMGLGSWAAFTAAKKGGPCLWATLW